MKLLKSEGLIPIRSDLEARTNGSGAGEMR